MIESTAIPIKCVKCGLTIKGNSYYYGTGSASMGPCCSGCLPYFKIGDPEPDLRAQLAEAQADNAAMLKLVSEVLYGWQNFAISIGGRGGRLDSHREFIGISQRANNPHPGSTLLQELEQLRKVRDAARKIFDKGNDNLSMTPCTPDECLRCSAAENCNYAEIGQALAELDMIIGHIAGPSTLVFPMPPAGFSGEGE